MLELYAIVFFTLLVTLPKDGLHAAKTDKVIQTINFFKICFVVT